MFIKIIMKNIYILAIISLIILLTIIVSKVSEKDNKDRRLKHLYQKLNTGNERTTINENTLPLIENDSKYIELQTKVWINQREEKGYCYGLLEKDKIVMAKWIEKFNINSPKIYYYDYHFNFTFEKLKKVTLENPDKKFIIKISHLQSSFGIIVIPSYNSVKHSKYGKVEYLFEIYEQCLEKFKTCFVCNHDKNTAPTTKEIDKKLKETHYKLYETIEPGIIIQEYFDSYSNDSKIFSNTIPIELKILVYGDKIINGVVDNNYERYKLVYKMARDISKLLGSSLIRVDMFIKENDNPYIPYLNEISLSPNGGFGSKYLDKKEIKKIKEEVKNYKPVKMEIDDLIKSSPKRSIPIEKYLTDNDWGIWWNEKYRFGLLK